MVFVNQNENCKKNAKNLFDTVQILNNKNKRLQSIFMLKEN